MEEYHSKIGCLIHALGVAVGPRIVILYTWRLTAVGEK
jgi:hypothetical protein